MGANLTVGQGAHRRRVRGRVRVAGVVGVESGVGYADAVRYGRYCYVMADSQPFTSQLSIAGFALGGQGGMVPVGQVMGSCVFQAGAPSISANMKLDLHRDGRARGVELPGISAAFNETRAQALQRLRSQANELGAHAVLGLRIRRDHLDSSAESVEYVITGTAVCFADRAAPAEVVLSTLSVDEYWKLAHAGYEPVGIAHASVIYETAPSLEAMRALAGVRYREARVTGELPELSMSVSGAIEIALTRAGENIAGCDADHIVGVRLERELAAITRENPGRVPLGREPAHRKDLRVTVHVVGSAIRAHHARRRTERGTWQEVGEPLGAQAFTKTTIDMAAAAHRAEPVARCMGIEKGNADARRQADTSESSDR